MKLHWYCVTVVGYIKGRSGQGCTYVGYKSKKNFTLDEINKQKIEAGFNRDAVLLNITYLGKMTKKEFIGEDK